MKRCGTCLFWGKSVKPGHFCSVPIPAPVLPACVPPDYFVVNAGAQRRHTKSTDGKSCKLWQPKGYAHDHP